jgi:hypothetical protein
LFLTRRKRIVGKNPSLDTEKSTNSGLFDMRIINFKFVRQTETDDGKTRDISFWIIFLETFIITSAEFMDVGETCIVYISGNRGMYILCFPRRWTRSER